MGDSSAGSGGDSIIDRLIIILSYDGSAEDIFVNYTLLLLNFGVAASSLLFPTTQTSLQKWFRALASLLFFIIFQILLCFEVHCVGISLIWCAIMGWIWMDRRTRVDIPGVLLVNEDIVLVVDILVICYYALVSEPIVTVAHILAIVLLGIPSYSWTHNAVFTS
mmetsp:Transcript_16074/g.19024  ORF Transcript_16074/g.19024 Transcript_16074/m.19024 type:complete len:164 (-) Transcript_16074:319-810(-)